MARPLFAEVVEVQQHGLQLLEAFQELVANPSRRAGIGQGERFHSLFQPQRIGMAPQQLPKTLMIALRCENMFARLGLVIEDADQSIDRIDTATDFLPKVPTVQFDIPADGQHLNRRLTLVTQRGLIHKRGIRRGKKPTTTRSVGLAAEGILGCSSAA